MFYFLERNTFFFGVFDVSQQDMTGAVQIIEIRCKLVLVSRWPTSFLTATLSLLKRCVRAWVGG